MCKCNKCELELNPERVPIINGTCWDCFTSHERMTIKETYAASPSIVDQALVEFFEWYETNNDIKYVPERTERHDFDFQKQAGTEQNNFWEKTETGEKPAFKPNPNDKRRRAPGL